MLNSICNAFISIHTPRVGSDLRTAVIMCRYLPNFNPHSPCGERRSTIASSKYLSGFQSTLPVWGATRVPEHLGRLFHYFNPHSPCGERHPPHSFGFSPPNFNPHSPCGERPWFSLYCRHPAAISIHTPRVGSDNNDVSGTLQAKEFQSTLPVWGATHGDPDNVPDTPEISIHTPRVGSDAP